MCENVNKKCLKFSIQEKLNQLPRTESELADRTLYKALGISRSTWFNYKTAKCGDKYDLPLTHAIKLARYFKCKVEDLVNIEIEPLSTIELLRLGKNAK